jgi:hypothetical protein
MRFYPSSPLFLFLEFVYNVYVGANSFLNIFMEVDKVFSISSIINFITAISLGLVILFNSRKKVNVVYAFFSLSIAVWSLGYYFWMMSDSVEEAVIWSGVLSLGSTFIPITYYHWLTLILEKKREWLICAGYAVSLAFSFFAFSDFYLSGFNSFAGFDFWPQAGVLYPYYV